jgi:hypothetical protein
VLDPRLVHVGFVVDKMAVGQVCLQVLWFSQISIIPPMLHTRISFVCHQRYMSLKTQSFVNPYPANV